MTALELFFGDVATREKARRFFLIALVVIGLDLVTKLIALWFAPVDAPLTFRDGAIEIHLMEGASLLGASVRKIGSLSQLFVSGALTLVLSIGGLTLTSARDRPLKKSLIVLGILVCARVALLLPFNFPNLPGARFVGICRAIGVLACTLLLLRVVLNKQLFIASSLLATATLANLLNAIWHPAGIIDFIWIRALRGLLGVTNVADLVMTLTSIWVELLFVLWLAVEFFWRLSPRLPRSKALRAFFVSTLHP